MGHALRTMDVELIDLSGDLRRVYDYWCEKAEGGPAPCFGGFRLWDLPAKVLPWSGVVDVLHDPLDFVYRYWGTERTKQYGADLTGRSVRSFTDEAMRNTLLTQYSEVLEQAAPAVYRSVFPMASGLRIEFQSLRLPLVDEAGAIEKIYVATTPLDVQGTADRPGERIVVKTHRRPISAP